ncbi:MAG: DHH family phosphoesterase [Clostridia bacterium]|nr:DHH family phosphoesterase [Clostridia bacterium]
MTRPPLSPAAHLAADFLREHDNFLLLTHARPDGDTIGSAYALCLGLRAIGKQAGLLYNPAVGKLFAPYMEAALADFDLSRATVVTVDIADSTLFFPEAEPYKDKVALVIDHHKSNRVNCSLKAIDEGAAAACELVREILELLPCDLSPAMAEGIYMGLMTDSGCFRFSNVRQKTQLYAADAIAAGADAFTLARCHFIKKSRAKMALESTVFSNVRSFHNGQILLLTLPRSLAESLGAREEDVNGLASMTTAAEGCEIGIFCREMADGSIKASVRTDLFADAALLCSAFGGGGHAKAAGCTLNLPMEEAAELLVKEAEKQLC